MKERITPQRQQWRNQYWHTLRQKLREHLAAFPKGEAVRLAKHLNIATSHIHRWSCPKCEHNAEPKYSLACALAAYLTSPPLTPDESLLMTRNGKVSHRTIFQAYQAKPRWPVKLMEVVREGRDWIAIPLN